MDGDWRLRPGIGLSDPNGWIEGQTEMRATHSMDHSHLSPARRRPSSGRRVSLADYAPLAILLGLAALTGFAKVVAVGKWQGREWMLDSMGFFLVMFSMFKLFDLSSFADGFQKYDLLGRRVRAYALVYPFIELGLGLVYLARWNLPLAYGVTTVVMVFGALGVLNALRHHLDLNCACMGTVLRVPLSTVALVEDFGMAGMAAAMWLS